MGISIYPYPNIGMATSGNTDFDCNWWYPKFLGNPRSDFEMSCDGGEWWEPVGFGYYFILCTLPYFTIISRIIMK